MPRLFIAIDLPERIKDDITSLTWQFREPDGSRKPSCTSLRFIGEVDNTTTENRIFLEISLDFPLI